MKEAYLVAAEGREKMMLMPGGCLDKLIKDAGVEPEFEGMSP